MKGLLVYLINQVYKEACTGSRYLCQRPLTMHHVVLNGGDMMKKENWKRIGRVLAAALLAGSLTVGAVGAVALAVSPQPVSAAVATT